jgi:hypothetical protein
MSEVRGKWVLMFTWCTRFADKETSDNLQTSVTLFISLTDIKMTLLLWLSWTIHRHLFTGTYWIFLYLFWPNYDSIFNRVIYKVRTTRHQNSEFGHTQGEIKKNRQKKYISIQGGMKLRKLSILVVNWVSPCLSFFMSISTAVTCMFSVPNCTSTIINLELFALNAEFQHFILSCNISYWDLIKCLDFADPTERRDRK